jgi:multidrug resistance efflux pump
MALEPLGKAITVQEKRMEEISARRTALILKSPFDGVVSQIQARPGQAVLPGVPILTIAQSRPTEIIAYADENRAGQIRENMEVELVKTSPPAQIAKSQITHIGPAGELMPVRLLRNSNIPQWGRPFLIKIPPGLELTPGESVGIRGL